MANEELLLQVNPVFLTAKGCIGLMAGAGIEDAQKLMPYIDMSALSSDKTSDTPAEVARAYSVNVEVRYNYSNLTAFASGCDVIVDLPCGYAPRALAAARAGKQYYGFDLPAVINEMAPAVEKIASEEEKKYIHFAAVDATNYDSLRKALDGVTGKLCIVMDGLVGFFTDPELDSLVSNVHRLLDEFGGVWTTPDPYVNKIVSAVFTAVFGNSGIDIIKTMTEGSSRIANTNSGKNAMSNGNPDDAIKYLKQHGFEIELVNYSDKLPMILSLGGDTEAMKRLRKEYADIPQMVITAVRSDVQKQRSTGTGKFSVNMAVSGNELKCALSGRLDTITAPELLQKFNETTGDSINKITVDLTETEYISSAGLRVMLIMCKSLKEKREFSVINYSKELKEIFDVTGFSEIFGIG